MLELYLCRLKQSLLLLVPVALILICIPASAQRFTCSSNGQRQECQIPGNGNPHDLRMVRQYSQQPCIEGRSWGRHGNRVWVDQGCRADFVIGPDNYDNRAYQGGPDYDHDRDHDRDHQGPGWDRPPAYYSGNFSDGHSHCSSGQGSGPVFCQSGGAFTLCESTTRERCLRAESHVGSQPIRLVGCERLRGRMGDQTRGNSSSELSGWTGLRPRS